MSGTLDCRSHFSIAPGSDCRLGSAGLFLVLTALLIVTVLLACSGPAPGSGTVAAGDTLTIRMEELDRTNEVRYPGIDEAHYRVMPTNPDNELVMVRLTIWNSKAKNALLTLDSKAAQLRGTEAAEEYTPINVDDLKEEVGKADANESKYARPQPGFPSAPPTVLFLLGSVDLPQHNQLSGWMVFEVPKGIELQELRWAAGDTVYLRF